MNPELLVIDAATAIKWVVEEAGTAEALALLAGPARLIAPEPLVAECADVLWKKARRGELTHEEASLAARLLQSAQIELVPTRALLEPALRLGIELDQPAQACLYLALAVQRDCRLVTADECFVRTLAGAEGVLRDRVRGLKGFAAQPAGTAREAEATAGRAALLAGLKEGAVMRGTVRKIADYGAIVDLGGIDGLLHITDMAWRRVKDPAELVKVGDAIDVRILNVDRERSRVSLGIKQLTQDPWENIERRYPVHTCVPGRVTDIAEYGAFVEVEDGVVGLVHCSEMEWGRANVHPADIVHTGQQVEVMVLDVSRAHRRMALGLKQCRPNPAAGSGAAH